MRDHNNEVFGTIRFIFMTLLYLFSSNFLPQPGHIARECPEGDGDGDRGGRGGGFGGKRDRPEPVDWDRLDCPGRREVEMTKAMNELSYNPIKTKFCTLENSDQRRAGK